MFSWRLFPWIFNFSCNMPLENRSLEDRKSWPWLSSFLRNWIGWKMGKIELTENKFINFPLRTKFYAKIKTGESQIFQDDENTFVLALTKIISKLQAKSEQIDRRSERIVWPKTEKWCITGNGYFFVCMCGSDKNKALLFYRQGNSHSFPLTRTSIGLCN